MCSKKKLVQASNENDLQENGQRTFQDFQDFQDFQGYQGYQEIQ
jgi:hypothetical protein